MAEPNGITSEGPSSDPQPASTNTPPPSQAAINPINPVFPATSLTDNGLSRRPRDARLIHMILANLGVTAYQERVPLQLMDFAYRYTSSTLQDALHLTSEGYGGSGPAAAAAVVAPQLRTSVTWFNPSIPKEYYQDLAQERNRVALPAVGKDWGVRLPPERYCLTGVGWGLREEWDGEEDELAATAEDGDEVMNEGQAEDGERIGEDEADDRMEDVFGEQLDREGEDKDMAEE
ncbi:MAG: transcription initiation factor TFIID subunit 9 [Lasallia pustulata]|uniref:Transcription initiation factor TFIID subunit 9 n=1 Tax=Lasallia pustulata TaxID=136370 RepID=A0A5M8Q2R1_9LECA|nr:MAG: transcription initiation factor TFIID subunit 9 [Lasallia pustulata]